tara:strand:- start:90 stop:1643 length:1554 start_codon:yes stop_codon:yes gene_type:complete
MNNLTVPSNSDAILPPDNVFVGRHLINGNWRNSSSGEVLERYSPAHGFLVSRSARGDKPETEAAIAAARQAFSSGVWSQSSGRERAQILLKVADLIERDYKRIALYETMESGKPITQAQEEIQGAADMWRYAASLARTLRGDTYNSLGAEMLGLVLKQPVGVVSIITPWNFPFLIVSQKLPFVLAAGCTAVVKPSEFTPVTTVILGELLLEAGLPEGVVNIVLGSGDLVGSIMSTHPQVDMVTFTGSTEVGKAIVAATSKTLKKVSLELGGKNPQVIFSDADLDSAVDAIVFGICFNAGECCNSGSRIIVHKDVVQEVTERVVALLQKVPCGDPLNPNTKVGAIISAEHMDKIHNYVTTAQASGATLEIGGEAMSIAGLAGTFYQPTVVSGVQAEMAIAREEVFGPVLSVMTFTTFEEAIELVNSTDYGLSAGVWSKNIHTCVEFARRAEAGTIWTNTWMDGFSELPFGGVKESGQGRELGYYGVEEFLELKTVQIRVGNTRKAWISLRESTHFGLL